MGSWEPADPGMGEKRCREGFWTWAGVDQTPNLSLHEGHTQVLLQPVHYRRFPKGSIKAEPRHPHPRRSKFLDFPPPVLGPWPPVWALAQTPGRQLSSGAAQGHCWISQAAGLP